MLKIFRIVLFYFLLAMGSVVINSYFKSYLAGLFEPFWGLEYLLGSYMGTLIFVTVFGTILHVLVFL